MYAMRQTLLLSTLVVAAAALSTTSQASSLVSTKTSAQSSSCTQATITISNPSEATLACSVANTLLITNNAVTDIDIEGPTEIGSLIIDGASSLVSITSSSITAITGLFGMSNLNALSNLQFSSLTSVGAINWVALNQLNGVTFGTSGVTQVTGNITISDTFLGNLDGLDVASATNIDINNNRKLVEWNTSLSTINGTLKLQSNGGGQININMPNLTAVGDMQVRDVQVFNVPLLNTVGLTLDFEENQNMVNFSAPSLTSVAQISFVDNPVLTNISMPKLTQTTNAFTIQNNTNLNVLNGFPILNTIRGAMILRGSFSEVELPSLKNVFGEGIITSTQDISSSCAFFDTLISHGDIQGEGSQCTSNNDQANAGGNNGTTNTAGGGGGDGAGNGTTTPNISPLFGSSPITVLAFSAAAGLLISLL